MFQFITNLKVYDNIMKKPAEFISNLVSVKSDKFQISFAVPSINLENLAGLFPGKIMAQHVDLNPPGPYTGSIPMESLLTYYFRLCGRHRNISAYEFWRFICNSSSAH